MYSGHEAVSLPSWIRHLAGSQACGVDQERLADTASRPQADPIAIFDLPRLLYTHPPILRIRTTPYITFNTSNERMNPNTRRRRQSEPRVFPSLKGIQSRPYSDKSATTLKTPVSQPNDQKRYDSQQMAPLILPIHLPSFSPDLPAVPPCISAAEFPNSSSHRIMKS